MFERFAAELDACRAIEEVSAFFSADIARHGFTVCAAGAMLPSSKGPEPHFFFQNWPAEWLELYRRRNFVAIDFSVAEGRRRMAPFTWLEAKADRTLSRAEQELWKEAVSFGWGGGFSVPLHGPGGYFAMVTMGRPEQPYTQELRTELHLKSFFVHERCRALTGLAVVAEPSATLTHRELECIRWVAAGKTDWEIAGIMGLSQTTVKSHVDGARRKLGARSRPQAVAQLVLNGLS
jgi:LuxR family quorum sensing-dependent transcriptional regulator